jgi:hypothetical protein
MTLLCGGARFHDKTNTCVEFTGARHKCFFDLLLSTKFPSCDSIVYCRERESIAMNPFLF